MRQINSPQSYLISNIIFAGVILLIMGYSLIFSPAGDTYPIVCVHEKITGQPCPSCGMSHAFSLIIRGRLAEAETWNKYAMPLFIFFVVQLFMRAGISIWLRVGSSKPVSVGYIDAVVSGVLMLAALFPLLRIQWYLLIA